MGNGFRRPLVAVLVGLAAFVPQPFAHAQVADASADGWWNRLSSTDGGLGGLPITPPSTVPGDAFAVGLSRGEVDKVGAVAVDISIEPGTFIDFVTLFLTESTTPGAQLDAAGAAVFACPAAAPWTAVHNGVWEQRPAAGCSTARIAGARTDGGSWTFDLTTIARGWVSGDLDAHGLVFLIDPELSASEDTQVSFLDTGTGEVGLFLSVTSAPPTPTPTPLPTLPPPPEPVATLPPAPTAAPTPVPTTAPEPAIIVTQPVTSQGELRPPNVLGNQPVVVWLGIPGLIGLALVTSYVLGPLGRPDATSHRRGPIGRVLDQRRATD